MPDLAALTDAAVALGLTLRPCPYCFGAGRLSQRDRGHAPKLRPDADGDFTCFCDGTGTDRSEAGVTNAVLTSPLLQSVGVRRINAGEYRAHAHGHFWRDDGRWYPTAAEALLRAFVEAMGGEAEP